MVVVMSDESNYTYMVRPEGLWSGLRIVRRELATLCPNSKPRLLTGAFFLS